MSVRDSVIKCLKERGVGTMDVSEFKRNSRKPISKGGVACRYFAIRVKEPNEGQRVFIKIFMPSASDRIEASERDDRAYVGERTWQYFQRECCILKSGEHHPNIQKCLGIVNHFEGSKLPGIVFEDIAVGNLQTFVLEDERASNATKLKLMKDVASALAFLHERQVVHRDLKATNVLVDEKDGKLVALLSDFGSAKDFGDSFLIRNSTQKASLHWMAPELWKRSKLMHEFVHGARGDIWAFGCTMIEVFAATKLVWSTDDEEEIQDALDSDRRPGRPASFPPWEEGWNFIRDRCLVPDPASRITSGQVVAELGLL